MLKSILFLIIIKRFDEFINKFQNLDVISKNSLQTSILAYKAIEILLKSFLFHETENERFILFFQVNFNYFYYNKYYFFFLVFREK